MSLFRTCILVISILALSEATFGQAARSPFSAIGLGEPYGNSLIHNQAMGGIGVSQPQIWFINNQNPALLVFNYFTVFQVGALVESRTAKGDTTNVKNIDGKLNYLVIALPIKPGKWTSSVGLMPYINRNYKLEYFDVVQNTNSQDSIVVIEQGSGGLSQFYWSNGVRLHDNWAVGLKAAYLFGSVDSEYSNILTNVTQQVPYMVSINEQTYIKDFQFTGGLSFSQDSIGKKEAYQINAGLTYAFNTNLRTRKTTVFQRRQLAGDPITSDTIYSELGNIKVPSVLTLGVSISKPLKWSAGAEFSMQNWSNFESFSETDISELDQSWRIAAGGEFTPELLSDKLLKRITYRAGLSYEKPPFLINSNDVRDFGINFGISLPAGRSSLDLAFSTGKRGDKSKNVLEETYFRVYFGVTFNDQWFIRRKFD